MYTSGWFEDAEKVKADLESMGAFVWLIAYVSEDNVTFKIMAQWENIHGPKRWLIGEIISSRTIAEPADSPK